MSLPVSPEEHHIASRQDHWYEWLTALQTVAFFIFLLQKAVFIIFFFFYKSADSWTFLLVLYSQLTSHDVSMPKHCSNALDDAMC